MTFRLQKWIAAALITGFVLVAGSYSVVNPLFEAPDEVWHYEYVRWLVDGHGLPSPEDVGHAPWHQEGSQPPLYYWLGSLLTAWIPTDNAPLLIRYNPHAAVGQATAFGNKNMLAHSAAEEWPWQGVALAAHLLRFFSIALGAVTLSGVLRSAALLFPNRPALIALAGLWVAANPQFLFLSAAISNDNLVTACCTVGLWLLLHLIVQTRPPTRWQLAGLGLLLGLAALSKVSGLALTGLAGVTLVGLAARDRAWPRLGAQLVLIGVVALAVAGWWYGRNWLLYGDPLGLSVMFAVLPGRDETLTWGELFALLPGVWRSFWAVFGWFNIVIPEWIYTGYTVLAGVGLAGVVIGGWRVGWQTSRRLWAGLALLLIWLLLLVGLVLRWAQISYPQGRLLFPAISSVALLLTFGWAQWLPRRWQAGVTTLLALALIPLAIVAPGRWIAPVYAPPPTRPVPQTAEPLVTFGEQIVLQQVTWPSSTVQAGDEITVTLDWQAATPITTNYSLFIHLIDELEITQVQRDSYPAAGAWPTSNWPLDRLIRDHHRLTLPHRLPTPIRLRIELGVYDFATGQRLSTASGETAATLGQLTVEPAGSDAPPVAINFGDQLALVDYEFDHWLIAPGETFAITMTWEALTKPALDYVVFVHLLFPPDAVWAQRDAMPHNGEQPTSSWEAGQRVVDRYELRVPPEAPVGLYTVQIGLYDPATGERLKVNLEDAGVPLGQVRVATQ